jgi:hypothetical protein
LKYRRYHYPVIGILRPERTNKFRPTATPWGSIWDVIEYALKGQLNIDNKRHFSIIELPFQGALKINHLPKPKA